MLKICEYFQISINDLVDEKFKIISEEEKKENLVDARNKVLITLLGVTVIWIIASVIFIYHNLYLNSNYWIVFVWAVPLSFFVGIIANAMWGNRKTAFILSSCFIWTFLIAIYLHLLSLNLWMVFILGVPLQIAIILWSGLKKNKKKK